MSRIAAIFPTADAVTLGPLAALFADNPRLPVQMLAFCAVFLYFFLFWRKLGPAPAKGAITPRSCPPVAGQLCRETSADASPLSPLAVDYLRNATRISGRGLAAAFLDLTLKGLCAVHRADTGGYVLEPRPLPERTAQALADEERAVYDALIRHAADGRLVLRPCQAGLRAIAAAARHCLQRRFPAAWRLQTRAAVAGWFVLLPPALVVSVLETDLAGMMAAAGLPPETTPAAVCGLLCAVLATSLAMAPRGTAWRCLIGLTAGGLLCGGLWALHVQGFLPNVQWVLPALMLLTALIFTAALKTPSQAARTALDGIEGLALYLRDAGSPDRERTDHTAGLEPPSAAFRRLLPYALALGLEKAWCDRCAAPRDVAALHDVAVDADLTRRGWGHFLHSFRQAVDAAMASPRPASRKSLPGLADSDA